MTNKTEAPIIGKREDYKGHPMLKFYKGEGDKYPFAFGLVKAKLIMAHLDDIKTFIMNQEEEAYQKDKAAETKVVVK